MQDGGMVQIVDTEHLVSPAETDNLYNSRRNAYESMLEGAPEVTILVIAYNRLEKTKRCVASILEHTKEIDYELLLVDNGSETDTLDYFQSVQHPQKRIIRITKNLGSQYALNLAMRSFSGRYFVQVTNDVIVTKNWLSNLLRCMKSDPRIGIASPGSSNVSNLQEIPLTFSSYDEMQKKAADYNRSDPRKWEERLRLITVIMLIRREVIEVTGMIDRGFYHDFSDDDFSVRVRRAGYKLMLCMDTFVHHDHDFRHGEDKDQKKFQLSLEKGRKNFQDKYYGLDSWSDMTNYEEYLPYFFSHGAPPPAPHILGVDVRCGLPVLQIKNELRHSNIMDVSMTAFTTEAKYLCDLQTVCDEAACDRIERISDFLEYRNFDYIILGRPINTYSEFPRLLRSLLRALRPGGVLFLKLRNTQDILSYLTIFGYTFPLEEFAVQITLEQFNQSLQLLKVQNCNILNIPHQVDQKAQNMVFAALEQSKLSDNVQQVFNQLMVKEYAYRIKK